MTLDLDLHLQEVAGQRVPLWLDAWTYGVRVLRHGAAAPWDALGELVAHHRQLQALVRSDVVTIDVRDFYEHWLQRHPALLAAMAEKPRLGYALRTLLADSAARDRLQELAGALCESYSDRPVVLALSSPRAWMAHAHCRARGLADVEVSWDDAESAAIYLADFLRGFAQCGVNGVLLMDQSGNGPCSAAQLARYQPVLNVARHYRWQPVLLGWCSDNLPPAEPAGFELILEQPVAGAGAVVPNDFWQTGELPAGAAPRYWYCTIPEGVSPESVLERLDILRGTAAGT